MEGRAAVASASNWYTATTERGPPDHPKRCAQNAHNLRPKGLKSRSIEAGFKRLHYRSRPTPEKAQRPKLYSARTENAICSKENAICSKENDLPVAVHPLLAVCPVLITCLRAASQAAAESRERVDCRVRRPMHRPGPVARSGNIAAVATARPQARSA